MNLKIKARNTSASAQLKRSRRKKIRKTSEWIEQNSPRSIHNPKKCFIIPTAKEPFKLSMFKKTSEMLRISGKYDK